jgi:hypothetical protein
MDTPAFTSMALEAASSVIEKEEPPSIEQKKVSYKPCRIVALTALILILGFCCFLIQKTIYVMEYMSSHDEQFFSRLLTQLACYVSSNDSLTE